jgi:hypothetical protein
MKLVVMTSFALFSVGCVLAPEPRIADRVAEGTYCLPVPVVGLPPPDYDEESTIPRGAAAARGYSAHSLDVARAIGAYAELERLADATARNAPAAEIEALRARVNNIISVARFDLASMISYVTCEEGRANQIATSLRSVDQQQTTKLTVYSLVFGAAAAVAGGVLAIVDSNPTPSAVVGIGGGIAGSAAGLATLNVHRTTTFHHARNILADVWTGDEHANFPETVWAYLTRPGLSNTKDLTLRDHLANTWKESQLVGDDPSRPSQEKIALYFGAGGTYDVDGLEDRTSMLREVREIVNLMSHGLKTLWLQMTRR